MPEDRNVLRAGILTLERGAASSPEARLIGPQQAAWLVNSTVRGGFPRQRPVWRQIELTFPGSAERTIVEGGRFQGATHFAPRTGIPAIYASISGRQWRFDVWRTGAVPILDVTALDSSGNVEANPSTLDQVWWVTAEDFLVMQDGLSRPWVTDGGTVRRLGRGELPTGMMMEYALGRIWTVLPDQRSFVAGDLVGSSSGTNVYNYRDSVLKMTENVLLNGGGSFAAPSNSGLINAVRFMPTLDTSLGQGPVQFFTDDGAFSVNAPFDRAAWATVTYPIQTISLDAPGSLSQDSTVAVNGDIWYRGSDGIRSFIVARRDFTMWGNVPMSEEMKRLLTLDTPWLLNRGSAVLYDNRLLMTASPRYSASHGVYHDALAVMNFDLISSLGQRSQPCWEGMWTGRSLLKLFVGEYRRRKRCFAFVLNTVEGNNELWELVDEAYDTPLAPLPKLRVKWAGETRLYDYRAPAVLKKLDHATLELAALQGTVDAAFSYRCDDAACWHPWSSFQLCATTSHCGQSGCLSPSQLRQQRAYRSRISLPEPPASECQTGPAMPATHGLRNQVRWEVTGPAVLKQLELYSRVLDEPPFGGCEPSEAVCTEELCCPPTDYLQSVE